ncbi:predicted acyltransferase [Sanguibacter keddieii DSM 10542]|uniref:Predicted acyltransferase n=1 Tax=Sanguibacter keddieii (strain ATCC 51767 / DSM 10542 / NCFB 3025 / ST-74) TaxID=446469 RepID=D1BC54_SANKS|nr:acyltransferase family protein [Sanguibacter keddieii]ACZ20834.1 predicted acyltransferase [Sanguibacter keddieii DSM 10542]
MNTVTSHVGPADPAPTRSSTSRGPRLGYRPDIEGLRAVAIGLVLIYHAGLPWIPGGFIGVDVFFVISGFLITGVILREVAETGRLSLVGFYARRAKRLLPATVAVLVTTAVLTVVFLPVSQRAVFGGDIAAAAGYIVNWRLADRAVDYLAEDAGSSPVQHFWSLAVEEQFYVVWPVLIVVILAVGRLARRGSQGKSQTLTLGLGLAAIAVPSFLWALHLTPVSPNVAFFVTTTRLWELGVGAAVALSMALLSKINKQASSVLATVGLLAIIVPAFAYGSSTTWPGPATLVPVLGTAAVIAAGVAGHENPVRALLSWKPAVWIGGLSYSLYLWHWPLLVFATAHYGELGVKRGLLVVALSFIPAYLSLRFIENPVRRSKILARRPGLTLSVGLNCTLVGILAGALLMVAPNRASTASEGPVVEGPGAAAIFVPGADLDAIASATSAGVISPDPMFAVEDAPQLYIDGCQMAFDITTATVCDYGDLTSDRTMIMVGDSKIAQWQPPLEDYAVKNGYKLQTLIKSSCTPSPAVLFKEEAPYTTCADWSAAASEILLEELPDVVIYGNGATRAMNDPQNPEAGVSPEALADGIAQQWRLLEDAGIEVVVLLDNPSPGKLSPVYDCVLENPDALDRCSFPQEEGESRSAASVQLAAASQVPEVDVLDLTDALCPAGTCPAVIGDTLVYRQGSHLTTNYVRSVGPQVEERLHAMLGD